MLPKLTCLTLRSSLPKVTEFVLPKVTCGPLCSQRGFSDWCAGVLIIMRRQNESTSCGCVGAAVVDACQQARSQAGQHGRSGYRGARACLLPFAAAWFPQLSKNVSVCSRRDEVMPCVPVRVQRLRVCVGVFAIVGGAAVVDACEQAH